MRASSLRWGTIHRAPGCNWRIELCMRARLLSVCLALIAAVLAGCTAPLGSSENSPVVSSASETLAPSLSPTGISTSTVTPTLAPTDTPTNTPSLQVTLAAVGDLMLGRSVGEQALAQGPEIVFAGVQSVLDAADIRVGNLECALTTQTVSEQKRYTLQAPPELAEALASGGFDLVSVANNHAMDFGYPGLLDSQEYLHQVGVATVGAGKDQVAAHTPVIVDRNGLRLAFLAYVDVPEELDGFDARDWIATDSQPGIAWADPVQIAADVATARSQADVVVVLLHSGYENTTVVTPNQRAEAHAAIDAGAALVLGSHPHILQSIERYRDGLIAYSLGNFVFDNYLGISNATIILRVVLTRQGVQSYDYVPVLIENGLPKLTSIEDVRGVETLVAP